MRLVSAMARLLSVQWGWALLVALLVQHAAGVRTGRMELEVTSNQAPEAFEGTTLHVHEGDRLTLTCSSSGTDSRRVLWYENTTMLMSTDRQDGEDRQSSTLVLDPLEAADDGRVVVCRVDSSTRNKKVTLKVQKRRDRGLEMHVSADPAPALLPDNTVQIHLGSKLELICTLQGFDLNSHRLSWWDGKEQLTTLNQLSRRSVTSSMTLDPVGVEDHLRTLTCRADGSTITRTATLEVQGIPAGKSQKASSILDEFRKDPLTLQAAGMIIVLLCGVLLVIACLVMIKSLHTYLKVSKAHAQQAQQKQQAGSSSASRCSGQKKSPAMKQSLKNQILASAFLPQRNASGTGSGDLGDSSERVPINKGDDGENNPAFVEEV